MASKKQFTVDDLWKLDRLSNPSLSPDGAQAVCSVASSDMQANTTSHSLWLLSSLGGNPRRLTQCGDKDSQAQWSPRGDWIAFIAKREQQGSKDEQPQLYLIAPDGGEARRVGNVATGVEAFKWLPDGKRIAFISWVWPDTRGSKAQAERQKAYRERKESAYITTESLYRHWDHKVPQGRVAHLHVIDVADGKVRDLMSGTNLELSRMEPNAHCFDVSPDGHRIVFAHDPAPVKVGDACFALSEIDVRYARVHHLLQDSAWDCQSPRYSPDGRQVAFTAAHRGLKHTMPEQLAIIDVGSLEWQVVSAEWDHAVHAPLLWEDDGQEILFTAEQQGRNHLWRFDLLDRRAELLYQGGWVNSFDKAAGMLVLCADSLQHPSQMFALPPGYLPSQSAQRIESFNDDLLATLPIGNVEEIWVKGALGDLVQTWLIYPPKFKPKNKYPLLHVIHGGPHTAFGDNWHFRWNPHLFAAPGYVVACVNYHGSSSFGYAFLDSITHRWGELETLDIEAVTTALLKKPWADKRRVFASGGSYGGYMVAWLNGHTKPGRYQAFVCHAGCFDWTAMMAGDAHLWHAKEVGANNWDDMARVHAQSPHAFARHMRTPTLVIHGALDYRVPDAQGLAYYNTLKAMNVDAKLLWFPDENHWILKPRNSKLWYQEFAGWLAWHDPGPQV